MILSSFFKQTNKQTNHNTQHKHSIITKPNLCGMVATVSAFDLKLVGCPMIYEHAKYPRNYYLFNVCFIFEMDVDTVHYFAAVRKLNQLLQALEVKKEIKRERKKKEIVSIFKNQFQQIETNWIFIKRNENDKCRYEQINPK